MDIGLVGNCLRKEILSLVAETDVYYIVFASAHHKRYQPLSDEDENQMKMQWFKQQKRITHFILIVHLFYIIRPSAFVCQEYF